MPPGAAKAVSKCCLADHARTGSCFCPSEPLTLLLVLLAPLLITAQFLGIRPSSRLDLDATLRLHADFAV